MAAVLHTNERKSRPEALNLFQVMEVSIEVPHNMRYRQGAAKFSVYHLLYFRRSKRQMIQILQRGRSYCARPRAKRKHNDEIIPFCSSCPLTNLAHANCTLFCAPNAQKRTGS